MLDDLGHEDPAQRALRLRLQVRERVGLLDLEPFAARVGDHVGVGVDAASLDPGLAEQRRGTRRDRSRRPAPAPRRGSRRRRAAAARGCRRSSRASAPRRRSSRGLPPGPAARPPSRALRNRRAARRASAAARARRGCAARPPRERSPRSTSSRIPSTIFSTTSLNIRCSCASGSTYQRSSGRSSLLDRIGDPALQPGPALERPVGADRPQPFGPMASGQQLTAPGPVLSACELLTKLLDECGHVDRNPCICRGFGTAPGHEHILSPGHYGSVSSPGSRNEIF